MVIRRNKSLMLNRREALQLAGMSAGALAAGSLLKDPVSSLINPTTAKAATFWRGADISWAQQMSANGYTWKNSSGVEENLYAILKGYGINAIRLRTWVNPNMSDPISGNCDQAQTIAVAKAAQAYGLPADIDFHFSDSWVSVGGQNPPAAWKNMTYSQMEAALGSYVAGFMNQMKSEGVTPGWVQLGNEINSGLCPPVGSLAHYPAQMTGLLMAGYNNVKAVFPDVPCIIHLAQPQNATSIENFFNAYVQYGGKWDITGFSSYGSGSEVPGILSNMAMFQSMYGRPVMQVEFGGPESNPSGTQSSLEAYINGLNGFGGLGVFYWEPEVYAPFDTYPSGAWQTDGVPTTALNGFLVNTGTVVTPYLQVNGGAWQQTAVVNVPSSSSTVNLGPQPGSGGSWSWSGPNGFKSNSRQINNIPLTNGINGANLYVATYTDSSGVKSTQSFSINVGSGAGNAITPYIQVNGGTWQQTATVSVPATSSSVNLGPQPVSGGSWSWSGPNGYSSSSRQIDNVPLSNGNNYYVATYNNNGVISTQTFTIVAP